MDREDIFTVVKIMRLEGYGGHAYRQVYRLWMVYPDKFDDILEAWQLELNDPNDWPQYEGGPDTDFRHYHC